jgi:hypothetical protein
MDLASQNLLLERVLDFGLPNRIGGRMDHNNLYHREWKAILKHVRLDGEGITFHALRQIFATALFAQGKRLTVVRRFSGTCPLRRRWTPASG